MMILKNSGLATAAAKRVEIILPLSIAAGVPSYEGTEVPEFIVEKGLAGSQVKLAQAKIDALLGSTNEVLEAGIFGSTAMAANDTLGFVLDCDGQIDKVESVQALVDIGAAGAVPGLGYGTKTALTDAAFTNPEVYVSATGNIAGRVLYTNITAVGTSGRAVLRMVAVLK